MNLKFNIKTIFYFIGIDIIILTVLVLEEHYVGSPGKARLEPHNPLGYDEILNNIYFYFIASTAMTSLAFWLYYLSNRIKK